MNRSSRTHTARGDCHAAINQESPRRSRRTANYVKRDTSTGRFMDQKNGGEPFKGVRSEH